MKDVSSLLFDTSEKKKKKFGHWIGPIEVDDDSSKVVHGRGLKVTRDVQAGDCLFIIPPILSVPVNSTSKQYTSEKECQLVLLKDIQSCSNKKMLTCILTQVGTPSNDDPPKTTLSIHKLTKDERMQYLLGQRSIDNVDWMKQYQLNTQHCQDIISRNAFGPDYHGYDTIIASNNNNSQSKSPYWRVLGLYPLAAMMNHSCIPNVVRVYSGNLMIAHATRNISKGEELVWSYLPPHSMSYSQRQSLIQSTFHFTCTCPKCTLQQQQQQHNKVELKWNEQMTVKELLKTQILYEKQITTTTTTTNNKQEEYFHRVDALSFYIHYFNVWLRQIPRKMSTMEHLLQIAKSLHEALQATNCACTEHLSILHMSYDISSWLHSNIPNQKSKYLPLLQYWTEQLKQTHMVRYGSLGQNIDHIRTVMKHTRTILRQQNGIQLISYPFL